jgi:exonuclease VII small subunit
MSIIEKISKLIKSITNGISKVLDVILKIKDIIWAVIVVVVLLFLVSQCNSKNELEKNVDILTNNTYALTDSLRHYQDEFQNVVAEKHALQLTQEQMSQTIGKLKKKNTEYITYINANIAVKDTVYVEKVVFKDVIIDTVTNIERGTITLEKNDIFNKSKRYIYTNIPYKVTYPSNLSIGEASFIIEQDIFVEGMITRNNKTKETMFYLKSDYPGITFNSGNGIVATNSKAYEREIRKRNGIGLAIGPSLGIYYDSPTQTLKPAFGLSVTIGYTFTPKIFQW